MIGKKFHGW